MNRPSLAWQCVGPEPSWCPQLEALLPAAEQALELGLDFFRITICADDSPEEESCWFRMTSPKLEDEARKALELYCSASSFARMRPAGGTVLPSKQIWDSRAEFWSGEEFDPLDFSVPRAESFLYHNLLLAQDMARGLFSISAIPIGQVEAFEAAWEVVVDGRLARAGLPSYSLADRRGMFSRLFSSAGVLMPDHWHVFQSLWDGGLPSGRDVLAVIRQLPRL